MKIAVYAENCTLAGQRATGHEDDEDWDSDDICVFDGDENDFAVWEKMYDQKAQAGPAGHFNLYASRVAETLREV